MDSLPVELLSRIFTNALPPEIDDLRYSVYNPSQPQTAISCVCNWWNQIAKSTPGLWTYIVLSNRAISQDPMKRRLELSGNLPLKVSMQLLQKEVYEGSEYADWGHIEVSSDPVFYQLHASLVEQ
ncbi:hypothetical protein FRC01_010668, partial [Tulasnella sp. 417]